jgi:hypothetical protein
MNNMATARNILMTIADESFWHLFTKTSIATVNVISLQGTIHRTPKMQQAKGEYI